MPKTSSDYDQLIVDLLSTPGSFKSIDISGSPSIPMELGAQQLRLTVTNMGFFDKLEESGR